MEEKNKKPKINKNKNKEVIFWLYASIGKTDHYRMRLIKNGKTSLQDFINWCDGTCKGISENTVIKNTGIIK